MRCSPGGGALLQETPQRASVRAQRKRAAGTFNDSMVLSRCSGRVRLYAVPETVRYCLFIQYSGAQRKTAEGAVPSAAQGDHTRSFQSDSLNEIDGLLPPEAVQVPRFKLLVSPVEPEFATQAGAAVEPSVRRV